MSAKKIVMGRSGPEKTPGFFSWRHATNAEHTAARETYLAERGPKARKRRAQERDAEFARTVVSIAYEQNVSVREARRVAVSSRRLSRLIAERVAS